MHFIYFSCLITVARTSRTVSNVWKEPHPCLSWFQEVNTWSFTRYDIGSKSFVDALYEVERAPSIPIFLRVFIMTWVLNFLDYVFSIDWCRAIFLSLPVNMVDYISWLSNIKAVSCPGNKPHSVTACDYFYVLLNSICYYFIRDFCAYIHKRFSFFS